MSKHLTIHHEITTCQHCPRRDEVGKCSELDTGGKLSESICNTVGYRDDCPLPDRNQNDAVIVQRFLKAKFKAELNDLTFNLHEDIFGLFEKSGKPVFGTNSLIEILKHLEDEKYRDVGFFTGIPSLEDKVKHLITQMENAISPNLHESYNGRTQDFVDYLNELLND